MSIHEQFAQIAREDGRAALVTVVQGPHKGEKLLVRIDGTSDGTLGDPELDAQGKADAEDLMWAERSEVRGDLFIDVINPDPRIVIFGAVEYAQHLSALARVCGWRPYVVDPRARFATPERFPDALGVVAAWPEEAFEQLGAPDKGTYIVILTHDPKLDDATLLIALRSDVAYIGAMGSKRAQKDRRERLLAAGVPEEDQGRISAPVGLDLGATNARETALSIMAELAAVRHGRAGGRLSQSKGGGRIHAAAEAK
ncbi:MAG: Xanthine and CO dehydrogenases maturation factor, XdhC/CoxF family [uncultured Solirubrobacteraceae bacterium]|uniref:Xanthine and CO dehydrogenases maturation factor, XdhC/CoxF family n=1 Tax=uncultured Solirubrobacteraceae bacterium TaxID=1162706 RepID=A0A6J4TGI9_9ACTN|nr:MAG: Xanthine and CO dehydrogenases maturation factor, XdhC/CoxF family [uncultured Solirubrobacteraceae bacterium]